MQGKNMPYRGLCCEGATDPTVHCTEGCDGKTGRTESCKHFAGDCERELSRQRVVMEQQAVQRVLNTLPGIVRENCPCKGL